MAGDELTLSAKTLRSKNIQLLGHGIGPVPMKEIGGEIPGMLEMMVKEGMTNKLDVRELKDVEAAFVEKPTDARIVFKI